MISVIIPISVEDFNEGLLIKVIPPLEEARKHCLEEVEVIIVLNKPSFGRVKAKNYGAEKAYGETLVFIDADCMISKHFLQEVSQKSKNKYFVGGGVKYIKLTRYSAGIICGLLPLALYMILRQITLGAFWIRKGYFLEMGGFREKKYDDVDFAVCLKKLAKKYGLKFESIKESFLVWSTRKFDKYGDWHWLYGYKTKISEGK